MTKIDKFFRDKKANSIIYIILTVGILMLVFAQNSGLEKLSSKQAETSIGENSLSFQTEEILSCIKGVGEVSVMISFDKKTEKSFMGESAPDGIKSVLVVAEGGDNSAIREKIVRATMAALGADAHKIEVFERKEKYDDGS